MAPLPDNSTVRVWLDYSGNTGQHSTMLRMAPGTAPTAAFAQVDALWDGLRALMTSDVAGANVRFSPAGSNVSFPIGGIARPGQVSGTNVQDADDASFITWVGRTQGGRRSRLTIFNTGGSPDADFREFFTDGSVPIGLVHAQLSELDFVAIDGLEPTWYFYVNRGWNAYWQRKYRRTR